MQIDVSFDQALSSLPTGFVTAVNYAVNYLDSLFTNNVTLNIDLGYGEVAGTALSSNSLGSSVAGQYVPVSYSAVKNSLQAENAPGAAALPSTSPLSGSMYVPVADAQALGLAASSGILDGYVGFSSTLPFSYSTTVTPAASQYYFVGVVEHEITEVMGRVSLINLAPSFYSAMDLYRYSAPGVHTLTTGGAGSTSYFSVDNGVTNLGSWNNQNGHGDLGDWSTGPAPGGRDAFNGFSSPGGINVMSASDILVMQALGWTVAPQNTITLPATTSNAVQGGAAVALLSGAPTVTDSTSNTLASFSVKISDGSGNLISGDKLLINGQQTGTVDGGAVSVTWNDSTKTLTLSGNVSVATYQSLLSQITYQDTGSDTSTGGHPQRTITWVANDGTTSYNTTSQITIDRAPVLSGNAASDASGSSVAVTAANGVLHNATDADADTLSVTGVSDASHGSGTVGQALTGAYGQLTLNADGSYSYNANNAAAIASAPTGSHLDDTFNYTVSDGNGGTATASLVVTLDRAPVASVANVALSAGHTLIAASSLVAATDADGDAITQYAFIDSGTNGGHFVLNGVTQAANQEIIVTAAQLSQLSYQGVPGADTLQVSAFDGTAWGASSSFTVTGPASTAPVVTASSLMLNAGQASIAAASLFSAYNPDGSPITNYRISDTTGSGHFVVNGIAQAAGTIIQLTAAQLANTTYVAGSASDQIIVQASDGTSWSNWNDITVSPFDAAAPVVTAISQMLRAGQTSIAATSLFSASDPDGGAVVSYKISDVTGNGHFVVNGVVEASNTTIQLTAAQLANTTYVAGQGSDVIVVQASDGVLSSNYQTLTVSPYDANPPVITASSMMLNPGQTSISAENLLPAYDPDGTAIMTYHVSDVTGNGYFEVDGVAQAANTILQLTAAQFAETTYVSGPGLDQIIVQASDGVLWSNWKSITVSGYDAAAPVVNVTPVTETTGKSVAASSLFSAVAADGGQISTYHLEELSGTGHFVVDGVAEAAGSTLTVTAAQLAQTTYQAGLGTDQIMVQASDGVLWSNWNQVSVTGVSSANFSVSDTLEISSPFSKTVTFADSTSTLKIDHASDFTGTIGGQLSSGNVIDLADVSLGPNETVAFSGNNSSGVLTVSDGTHTATIGLAGTYSASGFVASSDGQGGTAIVYSPPATPTVLDGSQGNQVLTATAGPTTLIGGQNDVLNAGTGTDTFVFHAGSGTNIVNGFTSGQDIIQLDQAAFANAEAVLAHVQQVGADAQIVINPQDVVTLHNVQVTSLHAADFHLV